MRSPSPSQGAGSTCDPGLQALVNSAGKAIAAGDHFTAAIRHDGVLVAWGANESGQIGDFTTATRVSPAMAAVPASQHPQFGIHFKQYEDVGGNWVPAVDQYGNASATLGANDTNFCISNSVLVGRPNRPPDQQTRPRYQVRHAVAPYLFDQLVERLFTLDSNYRDNLVYECSPDEGEYNSNSYLHGLLDAAGMQIPWQIRWSTFLFPGWNRPLPTAEFQPH